MQIHTKHIVSGSFLIGAVIGSNFLNFLFNALLGRWLSFENFGLITLLVTIYYVSSIFTNALSSTINFSVSKMAGDGMAKKAFPFFTKTIKHSLFVSCAVSIIWFLLTPLLTSFFHAENIWLFIAFIPVLVGSVLAYGAIGYFQGSLQFAAAGAIMIIEPIVKLVVGVVCALVGFGMLAYISLPLSLAAAALLALFLWSRERERSTVSITEHFPFPTHFFTTSLAAGIGATVFFSVDIFLVRHFFDSTLSGQYSLVSLIGKMVYFFAVLPNIFTLPIIARTKDERQSFKLFLLVLSLTIFLCVGAWVALVFLGHFFVPLLFGAKANAILSLLPTYVIAISLYAIASVVISFQVTKQRFLFGYISLGTAIFFTILITFSHNSLSIVISNMLLTCLLLLSCVLILYLFYPRRPLTHAKSTVRYPSNK